MKRKIVLADLRANKLLSFSTSFFMALSALLFALTCLLFVNLLGSIDLLMDKAGTPDFLQMHSGEIDEGALDGFAQGHESVRDYQALTFLNLENGSITLGGRSLVDSSQDNGVCVQSDRFDLLLVFFSLSKISAKTC